MNKKTMSILLIWYLISVLLLFGSFSNINENGVVHGWLGATRPGWLAVSLFFYVIFAILGFIALIKVLKVKNKKKIILLTSALVLVTLITQQIYVHAKANRSYSFTYRGPITPKDYGYIFSDIRTQMTILTEGEGYANAEMLCSAIDGLEFSNNQPLKDYHISLIHNKETNKIYLYGAKLHKTLPESKYRIIPGVWDTILLVNKALTEKPKGTYHSFKLSPTGNTWLVLAANGRGWTINSPIPPIPGCLYNVEEKKIYVPSELLLIYQIIYPNLKIPVSYIMKPK